MDYLKRGVLVTGASGGIGKSISLLLLETGYTVIACYHKNSDFQEELKAKAEKYNAEVRFLQFDISQGDQVKKALEKDVETNLPYYGVICNAGIARDNAFPAMPFEDWDIVLRTNLDSFYHILNPLIMPMVRCKESGRIITISSVSGINGNRGQANYAASKAGIIGATKSLAIELGKRNITVNCVVPGVIETQMVNQEVIDAVKPFIALKKLGKPEDIAYTVRFLLSPEASYITKQVICVDGGMI